MLTEKTENYNSSETFKYLKTTNILENGTHDFSEYSSIIATPNFRNSKQHIQTELCKTFKCLGASEGDEFYLMLMLPDSLIEPGTEKKDENGNTYAGIHRKTDKEVYLKQTLLLTINSLENDICSFSITFMKRTKRYVPGQKVEVEGWEKGTRLSNGWLHLKEQNELGFNVYFRPNRGGTFDADIKDIRLLFFEVDNEKISLEERIAISQNFALQPTFCMFTGGKSPQWYYRLDRSIPAEQFREYSERGIKRFGSDPCIKNPGRLMRLPGFCHVKYNEETDSITSNPSRILFADENNEYSLERFNELFPIDEKNKLASHILSVDARAKQFARDLGIENNCEFKEIDGSYFEPKGMSLNAWDLKAFFDRTSKEFFNLGTEDDRNNSLFRFAAFVIRRAEYLQEKYGASFVQSPLELTEIAGNACTPPYGQKEVNRIYHNAEKYGKDLSEDEKFYIDVCTRLCVENWNKYGKFEAEAKKYSGDGKGISREIKALRDFTPTKIINSKYVGESLDIKEYMNDTEKIAIYLNSPTGTGKSWLIESITEIAKQQNRVVIYATILNSTGKQASKKAGLRHKYFISEPNGTFASCIDSIGEVFDKFNEEDLNGCIFIIDEFNSVQKEITIGRRLEKTIFSEQTKEIKTRRSTVIDSLTKLGELASKVFLMDANLCDLDNDSATNMYFPDFKVHRILNIYKSQEEYILYQLTDDIELAGKKKKRKEELKDKQTRDKEIKEIIKNEFPKAEYRITHNEAISMFKTDVEKLMLKKESNGADNPKVLVLSSDNKKILKTVKKALTKKFENIRILLVCQDTKEENEVKQFMESPDTAAVNYDVILLSPTAGIGVDLAGDFYEESYFIHYGQIGASGCIQMIKRVRNPRNPRKIFLQGISVMSGKLSKSTNISEILDTLEKHNDSYADLMDSMLRFSKNHNFYDSLSFSQDSKGRLCNQITMNYAKYLAVDNYERLCNWQCFLTKMEEDGVKIIYGEETEVEDIKEELIAAREEILHEETNEFWNAPLLINEETGKLNIEEAWRKKNDETANRLEKVQAEKTILYHEYPIDWNWHLIYSEIIKHTDRPTIKKAKLALSVMYPDFERMVEYERLLKTTDYDGKKQLQYIPKRKSNSTTRIFHDSGIWELVENKAEIHNESKEVLSIKKWILEHKDEVEEFLGTKLESSHKNITLINKILKEIGHSLSKGKQARIDGKVKRLYKVQQPGENQLVYKLIKVLEQKHKHELYPSCVIPGRQRWEKNPEFIYEECITSDGKTVWALKPIPNTEINYTTSGSLNLEKDDSPTTKLDKILVGNHFSTVTAVEAYLQSLPIEEYDAIMALIHDENNGEFYQEPYEEFITNLKIKEEKHKVIKTFTSTQSKPSAGMWVKINKQGQEMVVKVDGLLPREGFEYTNNFGQYATHLGSWSEVSKNEKLEKGLI